MKANIKILIGVPPFSHSGLATDEVSGLKEQGFICETISYGRNNGDTSKSNRILYTVKRALALVKKIRKYKPDFLYLNSRFEPVGSSRDFLTLLIVKLLYRKRIKIVIKSHGSNHIVLLSNSFWFKNLVIPFLRNEVDGWIFLSTEEKKLILRNDIKLAEKIYILPNIIDSKRLNYSSDFKRKQINDDTKFCLLYAGRIVYEKGVFDIVNAIPFLRCRNNCKIFFIGTGDNFDELKKTTEKLHVEDVVEFKGWLTEDECDQYYSDMDALIYPTYDKEGFPMAIFKSVASGLPIITTKIRAAKDYLKEPVNTLWVEPKSPRSIAISIDKLYENPDLRDRMSSNNKQLGERFSQRNVSIGLKEMLLSLGK